MKATLFKKLSNEKTTVELQAGRTVSEALPDTDLDNAIIIVNSKTESPCYTLQEHDIVSIRLMPGDSDDTPWWVQTFLIPFGFIIYPAINAYEAKQAAERAQEELEKVKKLTNKNDIDNRPFLRGASNTVATGNSQPYIIGRHFFTPYLLCNPFYELSGTDGADEYIYTALECGFNKQIIQTIAIDDITIKKFYGTSPQEGTYQPDAGIFAEDGLIEISQDGGFLTALPALNYKTVSNACNDEIPKDSDVSEGTEEYLTYTLNRYAGSADIAISFPYGLYAYNDDNDKIETQVTITPQYSLDGGNTWIDFRFNNNGTLTNVFRRCVSSKELRYTAHKEFTLSDYRTLNANGQDTICIRVRSNGASGDSKIRNDCYVLYYQSVCFDPNTSSSPAGVIEDGGSAGLTPCKIVEDRERAYCTILGLRIKANKLNKDKLKKINLVTQSIARTWNGSAWSNEKTATRNPAAWALEIETSSSHPASRYDDSELDLESFGEFYEYCEENGFLFDYAVTQSIKKDDLLGYIMDTTGACLYYDIYGRRAVAIDRAQENALAVYNPQNIIKIQNKKTFGRRTDGLRIKYTNSKDDLYQEDTYLVMREENGRALELNADSILKDITVTGITTYEHIVKYARRLMAAEVLRPKTTTIEVGNEGIFYTPFSKILIQDDSLKIGLGSATIRGCMWNNDFLKKIYLNGTVTFEANKNYGIIVNCFTADGVQPRALKVTGIGTTDEMDVLSTVSADDSPKPEAGNIVSYGELDADGNFNRITTPYIIRDIKRADNGYSLELVNYNEAIYDSGTIPEYASNITQKPGTGSGEIPADSVTHGDLDGAIQTVLIGSESIGAPAAVTSLKATAEETGISIDASVQTTGLKNTVKAVRYELQTQSDGEWRRIDADGTHSFYTFDRDTDGYLEASDLAEWKIRAKTVNVYGKESDAWTECSVATDTYGSWIVSAPVADPRISGRAVSLFLSQPAKADGRSVYGTVRHRVQIRRDDLDETGVFFRPATGADYTAGEDAYKDGSGYVTAQTLYSQVLPLAGQNGTDGNGNVMPAPRDTAYTYRIYAENEAGVSEQYTDCQIIALATSAGDIASAAITTNKLADGCITTEKLHANVITADKMYSQDLAAMNLTLGSLSGNAIQAKDGNNYWIGLDTDTPEFRIGNDKTLEETDSDDAFYLHYTAGSLYAKFASFVIKGLTTVISGIFRVKNKGDTDAAGFMTVNPTSAADDITGTPAKTLKISGDISHSALRSATGGTETDNNVPAAYTAVPKTSIRDYVQTVKTWLGTLYDTSGVWWDIISVRHRNCGLDGNNYGMYLKSNLTTAAPLIYDKQLNSTTWQGEREIIDSAGGQTINGALTIKGALDAGRIKLPVSSPDTAENGLIWIQ